MLGCLMPVLVAYSTRSQNQLALLQEQPLPYAPRTSLRLTIGNATAIGDQSIILRPCADLAPLSVVGIAIGSVNEEFLRLKDGALCCRGCDQSLATLDRPLRLQHEAGEGLDVLSDMLQVPAIGLHARPDPAPDVHHVRAIAVAKRAHDWIRLYARVLSQGPEKWALRHLLLAMTIMLFGFCICAMIMAVVSRLRRGGQARQEKNAYGRHLSANPMFP